MIFNKSNKIDQISSFESFVKASRFHGIDWSQYELCTKDEFEDSTYLRNLSVCFKRKPSVTNDQEEKYFSCLHHDCNLGWLKYKARKTTSHRRSSFNLYSKANFEKHMALVHGEYKDHSLVFPFIGAAYAKFSDEETKIRHRSVMVCPYHKPGTRSPCLATFKHIGDHAHNPYREYYQHYYECHHQTPTFRTLPKFKFEISLKDKHGNRFQNCFVPESLDVYRETLSFLQYLCHDPDLNVFRIAECGEVTSAKVHQHFQGREHLHPTEYLIYLAYPDDLLKKIEGVLYMDVTNEQLVDHEEHNKKVRKYWETGVWDKPPRAPESPTLSEMFRQLNLSGVEIDDDENHEDDEDDILSESSFDSLFDEPQQTENNSTEDLSDHPDSNQENLHPVTNEPLIFNPGDNPDPQTNPFRNRDVRGNWIRFRPPTPGIIDLEVERPVRIPPRVLRELPEARHLQPPAPNLGRLGRIPYLRELPWTSENNENENEEPEDDNEEQENTRVRVRFDTNVIEI